MRFAPGHDAKTIQRAEDAGDALALLREANEKTEADVLRDALTWYFGSRTCTSK